MSKISEEKAFDKAIELVLHADTLTHKWTGRIVTVQTSLAIAVGALLGWQQNHFSLVITSIVILIGFVAITTLIALSRIVIREHEYGGKYIEMVKRTEGEKPYLFHDDFKLPPPGITRTIVSLKWILVIMWTALLVIVEWANLNGLN